MAPGPGGGHEHIHCSLKLLDGAQVPDQVSRRGRTISDGGEREGAGGEESVCACMPDARSPCVRVELPSCSTRRTRLMGARPEVQIGK